MSSSTPQWDHYDGAETCELVGLHMLDKRFGLYIDDGLAVVVNANGPKMDNLRKKIVASFKEEGLLIAIDTNLIETDFFNVSFD